MKIIKIISGGQTGADRAALDAAIACGVPHGGWCPKGRRAEDGPISAKYNLREMESESYSERTRANVEEADLTLIFSHGPLTGGSLLTQQFAEELAKPWLHIDLSEKFHSTNGREAGAKRQQRNEVEWPSTKGKEAARMCGKEQSDWQTLEELQDIFPNIGKTVLNVAGPRTSTDPEIYNAVYEELEHLLSNP